MTSSSGTSTAFTFRKSLCLNLVTPILGAKACFTASAVFPSNSAPEARQLSRRMPRNRPPLLVEMVPEMQGIWIETHGN